MDPVFAGDSVFLFPKTAFVVWTNFSVLDFCQASFCGGVLSQKVMQTELRNS